MFANCGLSKWVRTVSLYFWLGLSFPLTLKDNKIELVDAISKRSAQNTVLGKKIVLRYVSKMHRFFFTNLISFAKYNIHSRQTLLPPKIWLWPFAAAIQKICLIVWVSFSFQLIDYPKTVSRFKTIGSAISEYYVGGILKASCRTIFCLGLTNDLITRIYS